MKIQLDTVLDFSNVADFMQYLEKNNILMSVLTWNGPGGGHSVVEYQGDTKVIKKMMEEMFEMDEETIEFYLS